MNQRNRISGIHHITAIASSARENLAFYEQLLGLRLVKKTVNFDDPTTYHLYYGDAEGSPGTILTFFPWERLPAGKPGAGMVTAIAFAVPENAMEYWRKRLHDHGISTRLGRRFDEPVVTFADPHGLPLELIGVSQPPASAQWANSLFPPQSAIAGFHSATTLLSRLEPTQELLSESMGMVLHDSEDNRYRFTTADNRSPGHFYDVVVDPGAEIGRPGGGTVHHIAFRTPSDERQLMWQKALQTSGLAVTPVRDRKYFRSIYFHEPGGVLFEIATDPPGFTVDESPDELGTTLQLPDQYEALRSDIEKQLPDLGPAGFIHRFYRPETGSDDGQTIVALHGTGGSEHDLIELSEGISPTSAVVSPRGNVSENGLARFFRRLAEGVFDEKDVIHRANELADFIIAACARYDRSPDKLVALGYSNGANIAAAVMMLRPTIFRRAILLRPMLPLQNPSISDLEGKNILMLQGRHDRVIPAESSRQLFRLLQEAGASVTAISVEAGHELTAQDLEAASRWLSELSVTEPAAVP